MANTFQEISYGIIDGFRNGILGAFRVKKLCDAEREMQKKKVATPKQTSVLEQRRMKRDRYREITPQRDSDGETNIMQRIVTCCAWNGGLFLMSILLFNKVLLPNVQWFIQLLFGDSGTHNAVWKWMRPILSWTFSALWILPIFVLSKIVNCLWFQDIADSAYLHSRGKPKPLNISYLIADISFSVLLESFFLIQGTVFLFLPIPAIGKAICILHMALLYSLYAFEYKWLNMGWEIHKRLEYIQGSWPYFCGFGLPMAVLTSLDTSVVISGCIFSIFFPVFIISANEATEPTIKCSFPLKLFAPVVALSNAVFSQASFVRRPATSTHPATPKKHVNIGSEEKHRR